MTAGMIFLLCCAFWYVEHLTEPRYSRVLPLHLNISLSLLAASLSLSVPVGVPHSHCLCLSHCSHWCGSVSLSILLLGSEHGQRTNSATFLTAMVHTRWCLLNLISVLVSADLSFTLALCSRALSLSVMHRLLFLVTQHASGCMMDEQVIARWPDNRCCDRWTLHPHAFLGVD